MMVWEYSEDKKRVEADEVSYIVSQDNIASNSDDTRHIERNKELLDKIVEFGEEIKRLLDIGCREALTQNICSEMGISFVGSDVSPKSVKYAQSKGRNVVLCDAHKLTEHFDEKFDAIMSVHSLEHCYDPEKVLLEIKKCLRPRGYIGIRVPIQRDITTQPLLKDNAEHSKDGMPAHYSVFTPSELLEMISKTGFKKLFSKSINQGKRNEEFMIVAQRID